MFGTEKLE